ncbi:Icc protein [Nocardia sp. GAS34]|uniref:metallophosphoesterase n=1 Tax=unclassified Nocardia TaxID=2637762 RepID=UPI003D24B2DB
MPTRHARAQWRDSHEKANAVILLAQLSDTHFNLQARNTERVERVMAYLATLPRKPDAILVTGDITDSGKAEQYEQALAALRSPVPLWVLPGNHDDRSNLREVVLGEPASAEPINQAMRLDGVTVALLDSTVPGEGGGELDDDTFAWLTDLLRATPDNDAVLVALHHPPIPMHSTVCDPIRLANPTWLEQIVAADHRILGVLAGHTHAMGVSVFGGKPLIVAPGISSVIGGAWEVGAPDDFPVDYAADPAVLLHAVQDGRLTTLHRPVPMGGSVATL